MPHVPPLQPVNAIQKVSASMDKLKDLDKGAKDITEGHTFERQKEEVQGRMNLSLKACGHKGDPKHYRQ
jgi:hypothetical protein